MIRRAKILAEIANRILGALRLPRFVVAQIPLLPAADGKGDDCDDQESDEEESRDSGSAKGQSTESQRSSAQRQVQEERRDGKEPFLFLCRAADRRYSHCLEGSGALRGSGFSSGYSWPGVSGSVVPGGCSPGVSGRSMGTWGASFWFCLRSMPWSSVGNRQNQSGSLHWAP